MRLVVPLAVLFAVVLAAYAPSPPVAAAPEVAAADTSWSWPAEPENVQVLPADVAAALLPQTMRAFTQSLGVRCQHCHVGEEGQDFLEWDFASDAKPAKVTARAMMQMTWATNVALRPEFEGGAPLDALVVTCWTCHRGEAQPATAPE